MRLGPDEFEVMNNNRQHCYRIKRNVDYLLSDEMKAGNFQPFLKLNIQPGDLWMSYYTINELACFSEFPVKKTNMNKLMNNQYYQDVAWIQEAKYIPLNGGSLPLNFYVDYFYANEVGLIFQSSSSGETHTLIRRDQIDPFKIKDD